MSHNATPLTLTHTLVDDARQQLEPWLEEAATLARAQCSEFDFSGALTVVVTDRVWADYPGNVTNMADVIGNGDPPNIRARITWAYPAALDAAATAVEVMMYKQATDRHMAYCVATTRLATALVDSVGETNKTFLKTVFPGIALYALLPRQVIDAMITKHGVLTGDDIAKLRAPLSSPLMSLSGLVSHQEKYLLASQRLTRSGQGETPFKYFEMFLDTLKGFPLVLHSMTPYYAANPGIRTQTLATLFPFLEGMLPFLVRNDSGSPFSGAVTKANTHTKPPRNRPNRRANRSPKPANARPHAPVYPTTTRWSPHGPVAMSAASYSSSEPDPAHAQNAAEIARLNGIIADMVGSPSKDAYFGMPVHHTTHPNTTLLSESRPRAHYCWLHGWNNTHPGTTCNVMGQNQAYTVQMRNATGPDGTGGNPRVGVPVRFSRPQSFFAPLSHVCPPCLPSPSTLSHTHTPPPQSGYQR